jgi:D-alanyl-D-alanine carboxypeptidase/D-alanyl-D-alanine-endopeptidase (penicillin-binding protein 4)
LLLAILTFAIAPPSARGQSDGVGAALEAAVSVPALRGVDLSVLVVERRTGTRVFARDASRPLIPASNQKLLTAAAVLQAFGVAYRFETRLVAAAPIDAEGGVEGLCLVGAGDPALTSEEWWRLAADLRRSGLQQVHGEICLDDSIFDDVRWHPNWRPVSARAYHAPISGLSANYGAFAVEIGPGRAAGEPARVALDPPLHHVAVRNRATTAAGGRARLLVRRRAGEAGESVEVSGQIASGHRPRVVYRSTARPTLYAGALFRAQLQANGIAAGQGVRVGAAAPEARELHVHRGKTMAEIVGLLLKYSNNQIAESLVKSLGVRQAGAPGSWETGLVSLRGELERRGLPLSGVQIADGSGLSRENRVSAELLVALLRAIDRDFSAAPEILAALPIAGVDGTLKDRAGAARGRVRAKTGRLDGVASVSGIASSYGGREFIFSLIANGRAGNDAAVAKAIDDFLAALVGGA